MIETRTMYSSTGKAVDFQRNYIGKLEQYGPKAVERFGTKRELKDRLEEFYGVKLGKYVRQVSNEIVIFFSNKTGLTGNGWAQRDWLFTYSERAHWHGCLLGMLPGCDIPLVHAAYRHRYAAFGMEVSSDGFFESFGPCLTYLYFEGSLYTFHEASNTGWIELYQVPLAADNRS